MFLGFKTKQTKKCKRIRAVGWTEGAESVGELVVGVWLGVPVGIEFVGMIVGDEVVGVPLGEAVVVILFPPPQTQQTSLAL